MAACRGRLQPIATSGMQERKDMFYRRLSLSEAARHLVLHLLGAKLRSSCVDPTIKLKIVVKLDRFGTSLERQIEPISNQQWNHRSRSVSLSCGLYSLRLLSSCSSFLI